MAKIVFLGTAASIATKERDNTAFVFTYSKGNGILVDCPGSPVKKLKERNLNYHRITDIIITHHHPDHIYGLPSLIHSHYKRTKSIRIYTSLFSIKKIKKLLKEFNLARKDFPKVQYIDVFKKTFFFSCKQMKIRAFKNLHTQGSFGIEINYKNRKVVYTSDTRPIKHIRYLLDNKTYLIHDCTGSEKLFEKIPSLYNMHTNSSQLKQIALDYKPKLTIPIHFLLFDKKELSRIERELKGLKSLFIPNDQSSITLK